MKTVFEEYLQNPSQAIADAKHRSDNQTWSDNIDDELVYAQLASGDFRLYEAMIFSAPLDEDTVRPVLYQ